MPIAKTELTKKLEREIWSATARQGVFGCFEVTIGWFGKQRVDYITYDTEGIWRCYEIKVSKEDFYSKAHHTFVGHYNYYVFPSEELYEQVKEAIPSYVGVYIKGACRKKAKKRELGVDEQILKNSLIRSLYREVEKQLRSENPTRMEVLQRELNEARKAADYYKRKYLDLMEKLMSKEVGQEGARAYHDSVSSTETPTDLVG
jgi:hypothetical protein